MPVFSHYHYRYAPLFVGAGAIGMLLAQPLSRLWLGMGADMLNVINAVIWALAIAGLCVKMPFNTAVKRRFLGVAALFALSVFPFKRASNFITYETISLAGVILLFYGLLVWKGAHPFCAAIGKWVGMQRRISSPLFLIVLYALFLAMTVALCWHCYRFIPAYVDSIGQYVHGKFIAGGHLYGLTPPLGHFFPVPMTVSDGNWFAQYQPLHSMLLGLGHYVGAPWIINPLDGALTVALIYLIARNAFGEATARVAGMLSLGCSFMLFMSSEFMNHATALLFTTLLIYAYMQMLAALPGDKRKAYLWAIVAGLSVGGVFLTRPLTAIGVGLPFALYALVLLRRNPLMYLRPFLSMAAAAMLCLVLDLAYNDAVTGSFLLFPSGKYHNGNLSAMGIHNALSLHHMLTKGQNEWAELNKHLFDWWLPSTFFIMLYFLLPVRNLCARLLMGLIVSHTLLNMANQYNSSIFGPRYLYETTSSLLILSAAGITRIPLLLKTSSLPLPPPVVLRGIVALIMLILFATNAAATFPNAMRGYAHNFFNNHPAFYYSMLKQSEKPALIFIGRGEQPHIKYRWVAFTNPPDDTSEVIFAQDRGTKKDSNLVARYPGRHAYVEFHNNLVPFNEIDRVDTETRDPDTEEQ